MNKSEKIQKNGNICVVSTNIGWNGKLNVEIAQLRFNWRKYNLPIRNDHFEFRCSEINQSMTQINKSEFEKSKLYNAI